jgi:hypothetical protein
MKNHGHAAITMNNQEESGAAINIDNFSDFSEDGPGQGNLEEASTDSIS